MTRQPDLARYRNYDYESNRVRICRGCGTPGFLIDGKRCDDCFAEFMDDLRHAAGSYRPRPAPQPAPGYHAARAAFLAPARMADTPDGSEHAARMAHLAAMTAAMERLTPAELDTITDENMGKPVTPARPGVHPLQKATLVMVPLCFASCVAEIVNLSLWPVTLTLSAVASFVTISNLVRLMRTTITGKETRK